HVRVAVRVTAAATLLRVHGQRRAGRRDVAGGVTRLDGDDVVAVRGQPAAVAGGDGTVDRAALAVVREQVVRHDAGVIRRGGPRHGDAVRRDAHLAGLAGRGRRVAFAAALGAVDVELLQGVPVRGVRAAPLGAVHPHVPAGAGQPGAVLDPALAARGGEDGRP